VTQYVALLRGINVGGNNVIKMSDLKRCFEELGLANVATYIQSGNVLFEAGKGTPASVATRIEAGLSAGFGYEARIVLRSHAEMRAIVEAAPEGFGGEPGLFRYDVMFLKEPANAAEVVKQLPLREGVDRAFARNGVCYFSRLNSRATQSYLSKVVAMPIYKQMTVRNWNTTAKLLALMDART
jgi:uncharacterized protein (DUF1697 family)